MAGQCEASKVWKLAEQKLPLVRQVDKSAEIRHVLGKLAEMMPDLYTGSPVPKKTDAEMIVLARELSKRATEAVVQVRFSYLALGIEIGNTDFGWGVPLVPQLVLIKKPLNWATKENFTRRVAAEKLEQAFGRDLERPVSNDPAVQLGQLLFSAVIYGCLLERKWLEPFLSAVVKKMFFQLKGILWVEMVREIPSRSHDDEAPDSYYTKRFFPDNFTQALLYRLLDRDQLPADIPVSNPWNLLQAYSKTLPGIFMSELPGNLDEFLKLGLGRNLFLPGSLLAYSTGKLKSTSLSIGPWLRCISGKAIKIEKADMSSEQAQFEKPPKIKVPRKCSVRRQGELFESLMKSINQKGRPQRRSEIKKILEQCLSEHGSELSPAFQLLLWWGKQLLSPRLSYLEHRSKGDAVRPSSLRRYFRAIGAPFLLAAGNQDLTAIDTLELDLIYEQTIHDRQDDYMAPRCLLQFHGFLEAFYGLPPVESVALKGGTQADNNQNANLITLEVFELVLTRLGWGRGGMTRWQRIQMIAFIFCYRCGLRPVEVLNMRMVDLQQTGPADFELIVRVSPKTERGRRRIPASTLMKGEETQFVLAYLQKRKIEIGFFGDNFLLAHPDQKSGRLANQDVYGQTRSLLHDITGDDTLTLYHARHTFNSTLQVQFQLRGKPLFNMDNFINLDFSAEKDWLLRERMEGNENWGRKDQHVQGIITGHATPEMANTYYNHLSDALLGTAVRQRRDRVPVSLKTVMMLGNVHQAWASELLAEEGGHLLSKLVKSLAKKYEESLLHPLLKNAKPFSVHKQAAYNGSQLLPWEEVINGEVARMLTRGEDNWDLAFKIYKGVRKFEGKHLSMVAGVICDINAKIEDSGNRWRGPVYASITELRIVLLLINEIGIENGSILLVHHAKWGQAFAEKGEALKLWQERIDIPVGGWVQGEMANASSPKKGVVEVRIIDHVWQPVSKRLPNMNRGFVVVIKLLRDMFITS